MKMMAQNIFGFRSPVAAGPLSESSAGHFVFFKQKTAYEISACLVGSEMCIRDRRRGDAIMRTSTSERGLSFESGFEVKYFS